MKRNKKKNKNKEQIVGVDEFLESGHGEFFIFLFVKIEIN